MREIYTKKIQTIESNLIEMSIFCENSLEMTLKSLSDETSYKGVKKTLKRMKQEIEEQCINLLLEETPLATDFRLIVATLIMINDIQRIGVQSKRIGKLAKIFKKEGISIEETGLSNLGEKVIEMFKCAIKSVIENDMQLAQQVIDSDKEVNALFDDVKLKISLLIAKIPQSGELLIDLVLIAKYYERIGDHCANLARWINYKIKGAIS